MVCSWPSGWNLASAVLVVKSFEFEARIRGRRALREKSTLLLAASMTNAPLRPTRRKSFERPAESFDAETEVWAVAAPWAIGVEKALSGPPVAPLPRPRARRQPPRRAARA